uniref:Uncharacterized protein n=1 Tax=Schistocephalus solidus TaxID=70667 RepID=A0A0X3PST9_SCHSO
MYPEEFILATSSFCLSGIIVVLFTALLILIIIKIRSANIFTPLYEVPNPRLSLQSKNVNATSDLISLNSILELLPVESYPYVMNKFVSRKLLDPTCLGIILFRGLIPNRGPIFFITDLFELGCMNRCFIDTVDLNERKVILLRHSHSSLFEGDLQGISIEWRFAKNLSGPRKAQFQIDLGYDQRSITLWAVSTGIRCTRCGSKWFSFGNFDESSSDSSLQSDGSIGSPTPLN